MFNGKKSKLSLKNIIQIKHKEDKSSKRMPIMNIPTEGTPLIKRRKSTSVKQDKLTMNFEKNGIRFSNRATRFRKLFIY